MTVRLTIGYAFANYETKFVKHIFEALLDGVDKVEEKLFTPKGRPRYKKFFIVININPSVLALLDFIKENTFAAVVYNNEWDHKMHKYVDRYWKVFADEPRPVFRPFIMTKAQVRSDIFLIDSLSADEFSSKPENVLPQSSNFKSTYQEHDSSYWVGC